MPEIEKDIRSATDRHDAILKQIGLARFQGREPNTDSGNQ